MSPFSPPHDDPNVAILLSGELNLTSRVAMMREHAPSPTHDRKCTQSTPCPLTAARKLARHVNICEITSPVNLHDAKYKIEWGTRPRHHPPLATLEVDNPHTGTPVKTRRIEQGDDSSFSRAPRQFRSPEDRVAARKTSLPSGPLTSGDVNADPFAPTYTLSHTFPSGLITSSATPLTYDEEEDSEPEGELKQLNTPRAAALSLPDELPASASSPPPPVSRSVSPAPGSPALSDDQMDEDIDNTPNYTKLANDPGFGALIPTARAENPHKPYKGFAASGPEDHAGVPFQKHSGGGAGLVMSHNTAMTNVHPRVVDFIAEDPDSFILFVPFLGGAHFNKKYRDAASDLTKYLEEITGAGGIEIYPPTPREKGDFAGHVMYHPPWVVVGKCTSVEVRDELARHQLIACSRDLAVHVLKVDLLRKSWLLGHWRCNTLVPIPPAVLRAAVAIATFSQGPIRTAIVHATQNEEGTADERVYRFVQTLDVARLPSAAEPPLWIVYGKPCSESHAVWESTNQSQIRDLFRNTSFTKGLSELTPIGSPSRSSGSTTRRLALCYICKLDDHRSDTCPYALLPDWLGPNEVIKEGREGILALNPGKPQSRNGGARGDRTFRRNQRPRRD
ncbi:hypothetical protein B0H14DRAFT_2615818 [Mycena olivaceomarginata]|nr:hypothetical protein B0H14DRAFT_2615818 [Mycena olivaceomarginata]